MPIKYFILPSGLSLLLSNEIHSGAMLFFEACEMFVIKITKLGEGDFKSRLVGDVLRGEFQGIRRRSVRIFQVIVGSNFCGGRFHFALKIALNLPEFFESHDCLRFAFSLFRYHRAVFVTVNNIFIFRRFSIQESLDHP